MKSDIQNMECEYNILESDFLQLQHNFSANKYFLNNEFYNRNMQIQMISDKLQNEMNTSAHKDRVLIKLQQKWVIANLQTQEKLIEAENKLKSAVRNECQNSKMKVAAEKARKQIYSMKKVIHDLQEKLKLKESESAINRELSETNPYLNIRNEQLGHEIGSLNKILSDML
ncbi:unnamed protein product, partial [Meganyctiphanes norvegica]